MADEDTSVNQQINTTQPKPLKGLVIRGHKTIPTIQTVKKGAGADGEDLYMIINEEDYDKKLHGEKVDKLPSRGKKKEAAATKPKETEKSAESGKEE